MSIRNVIIAILAVVIVLGLGFGIAERNQAPSISQEAKWNNATSDMITVSSPAPGATVGKQFTVSGAARGNWYFEATFPLRVLGKSGQVIFEKPANALSDWMTTDFVQFSVPVDVGNYTGAAKVVLQKDNPSGDASKEASVEIPILIK